MKKSIFFLLVVIAVVSCSTGNKVENGDGWTLVWEENFESGTLNDSVWRYTSRGTADWAKTQSADPRCYAFRNGNLVLRGIVNDNLEADTAAYLCGGICTKGKKAFAPGRVEVRAKLQAARGAWPAIWLMPFDTTIKWPKGGEIDIMERLNYDGYVYQTVHNPYTLRGNNYDPKHSDTIAINVDDFNVYGVDIYRDSIVFHVNGVRNHAYPRRAELPDSLGQFPFYKSYHLLVDMQLGGKWVGSVDPADLPVEMEVDWVRYYTKQ